MARRKHKNRLRTPSGRLSRSKAAKRTEAQQNMAVALAQPHRAWLPKTARLDQLAESELGRLYLGHAITEPELWAGQAWQRVVNQWRSVIAAPRDAGSAAGRMIGDAFANCEVPTSTPEDRKSWATARYEEALAALYSLQDGVEVAAVVNRVVMQDSMPAGALGLLRGGLRALAEHWRMDLTPATCRRREQIRVWHAEEA